MGHKCHLVPVGNSEWIDILWTLKRGEMKLEHRDNCILVKYIPNRGEASGMFEEDTLKIYINSRLPLLERECIYLHEASHKECFLKKCKCWDSDYWCEYHAMKGELIKIIDRESIRLSRAYFENVTRCISKYKSNLKHWRVHLAAMQRLMKTKMFRTLRRSTK